MHILNIYLRYINYIYLTQVLAMIGLDLRVSPYFVAKGDWLPWGKS